MDRDLVCGVISLAIALVYLSAVGSIPESSLGDIVGASGVPHVLGYALVAVSIFFIGQRIVALWMRSGTSEEPESGGVFDRPWTAFRLAGGAMAISAGFILIFEPIGYIPSIALLLLAMGLYQGIRLGWRFLVISLVGAAALWVIFVVVLGVHMPTGVWPDLI